MKLRIVWHSFRESFRNFFAHPLVTFASVTTMTLMLTLLGAFIIFSSNISYMVSNISKQPPIEVYSRLDAKESDIETLKNAIENYPGVYSMESISPEENLKRFRENVGDEEDTFKYFDARNIPHTFIVRMEKPEQGEIFKNHILAHPIVYAVDFNENITKFLINANYWVQLITLIVMAVLAFVAFFVISNMIRISVFSRGDEIQIMKYVGATNLFIRFPYILEGAFVGILGAIVAGCILYFSYGPIYEYLSFGTTEESFYSLRYDFALAVRVLVSIASLGSFVGMLASGVSVRRHIRV